MYRPFLFLLLLVQAAWACAAAAVEVNIDGLNNELQKNVLAYMTINRYKRRIKFYGLPFP